MRVLLVHQEAVYFGGAEKVLGYFLDGLRRDRCQMELAVVEGSPLCAVLPGDMARTLIPANQPFAARAMTRQLRLLAARLRNAPVDLIHAWGARDWELSGLLGMLSRTPAIGTLHDHPESFYISGKRRALMRMAARWTLRKIVCVSEPLRSACESTGYPKGKLAVIHNGVPARPIRERPPAQPPLRIGFAGTLTPLKALDGFFAILNGLSASEMASCEIFVAGSTNDEREKQWMVSLKASYEGAAWFRAVRWLGWVADMPEFLGSLDLLIVPSRAFDSLPTVLLEAGLEGVPVLASRVGGTVDIIVERETGWLFRPEAWDEAVRQLAELIRRPELLRTAGANAAKQIRSRFSLDNMTANYLQLYSHPFA